MSHQNPDAFNDLDDELHSLFARATDHIAPQHDLAASVQRRLVQGEPVRAAGMHRSPAIAATLSAVLVVALLAGVFLWFGPAGTRPGPTGPTAAPTATVGAAPTSTGGPLMVLSVDLSVNPTTSASATCGSRASFTYTAIFHTPAHGAGGTIQFAYTLNNGRSQTTGAVLVSAGATSTSYTFVSSGTVSADHTFPGPAMVMVTSPNSITSPSVTPTGACAPSGAFQVTSVAMTVTPTSIAGMHCGTSATVTYTALFHLPPNGPGGTIQFDYTTNNGRSSSRASITVAAGQTTASYSFRWVGTLPVDHTYPEPGGVIVQSPNAISASVLGPRGTCS